VVFSRPRGFSSLRSQSKKSMTCFPYPIRSSMVTINFVKISRSAKTRTPRWNHVFGLFHGQTRVQIEQCDPFFTHQSRHFMAWTGHFNIPRLLDGSQGSFVRSPFLIAPLGQWREHRSHFSQKAWTPMSTGLSTSRGRQCRGPLLNRSLRKALKE
jgi:hypothetical protein